MQIDFRRTWNGNYVLQINGKDANYKDVLDFYAEHTGVKLRRTLLGKYILLEERDTFYSFHGMIEAGKSDMPASTKYTALIKKIVNEGS